ncbi:MAG: T9SS type A sorting domain-containing protein, partial [bacterium]
SYVDATRANTSLATGAPLVTTGPDANMGAADNQWHERTGFGNDGSVLASAEVGGENAPVLKTRVMLPNTGSYDVWVNLWANPAADWRIKAGLSESGMQIFRQMACKQVEAGDHDATLVLNGSGNTFLYQAYLGRVRFAANNAIEVFVDDAAVRVGTSNTSVGDVARTWYDGLSFARVDNAVGIAENESLPLAFSLSQNYPNPFNPATTITFTLPKNTHVNLKVYNLLGREVAALINHKMPAGTHQVIWDAQNAPSGVYFYKMTAGTFSKISKMTLLR